MIKVAWGFIRSHHGNQEGYSGEESRNPGTNPSANNTLQLGDLGKVLNLSELCILSFFKPWIIIVIIY